MKKLCTMLGFVFFVFAAFRIITAKDFATTKRRLNRGLGRYYPKPEVRSHCQLRHCNLLLFGVRPKTAKLEKCFVVSQIKSPADISEILPKPSQDIFILIIPSANSLIEAEALSVMVDILGNISVLLPANFSSGKLSLRCQSLKGNCYQMEDLQPILTQIKRLNDSSEFENAVTKGVINFGNNLKAKIEEEEKLFFLRRQVDTLIDELCKRNKKRNRLIEILKDSGKVLLNRKNNSMDNSGLSLKDLLPTNSKSYDKNRPPKLSGQPTVVYFHVTVLSLDSINEESMTYVADIFLAQSWRDPRLRLPERMSEQYRILDVNLLHDIWRPDCFFKNAKQVTFHEISIPNHYVWLYHDKTILYISKLTLVLSCAMKFESYPHDIQTCYIMIESLSHTVQDLIFLWNTTDPLVVYPEIELPQLDISNNYTTDCTVQYSTGNFTCLAVVFTLKRRLGYHLLHTYIPSALIVVMSWISFWIKPEAIPARVTLGVTSLLTLATQNTQSQQSLPPVSYVKAIDIWMSSCSVFVFLSLMEFAIVNNYMKPISTKTMTNYSEDDFRSAVNNYTLKSHQQANYRTCYGKEAAFCIDRFSRYFFPFSFFILNAVYWSVFV